MTKRGGSEPYKTGRLYEKRAKEALEGMGYFVISSHHSRGPIDLVAIPMGPVARETGGLVRLVQVKYGMKVKASVRRELAAFASRLDNQRILVEIWSYVPWQTVPFLESIDLTESETPSRDSATLKPSYDPRAPRGASDSLTRKH